MNIKVWDSKDEVYGKKVKTVEDAYDIIKQYLGSINFDSYYFRANLMPNKVVQIDYGSHSHFFYMQDQDGEDIFPSEQTFTADEFEYDTAPEEKEPSSLKELFENFEKEKKVKQVMAEELNSIRLEVTGTDSVAKLIEALTNMQDAYRILVYTDDFQSLKNRSERTYIIEIIDTRDGVNFVLDEF